MRKLSEKQKQYLIRYAHKKHLHEIKRELIRKKKRLVKIQPKKIERRNKKFINNPKKVDHHESVAPPMFSLLNDSDFVVSFFEDANKFLHNRTPVFFDLKQVTTMGPETFTYFIARIKENDFSGMTPFMGNVPRDQKIREMFAKAGFNRYVSSKNGFREIDSDSLGSLIHMNTRNEVEPELAGKVCASAMKHTFDTDDFSNQKFYKILIECMANTRNHSNYGEPYDVYDWWLLAYKESNTKVTKFCFLDLGVGIFDSLAKKYTDNKLKWWLKEIFVPLNNQETLRRIFKGERQSSTKLPGRGYGLNNIYNLVKENETIANFTMLTNDIMAKIGYNTTDVIKKNKTNFRGTMYYWELTPATQKYEQSNN